MADEGNQIHMEPQSNAGKWILTGLAILVVVGSAYAHFVTYPAMQKLASDLNASQAQIKELQNRLPTAEATEQTLGAGRHDQAGTGAEDRRVAGRAEGHESRLEKNRKSRSCESPEKFRE